MKKMSFLLMIGLLIIACSRIAWGAPIETDAFNIVNRSAKIISDAQKAAQRLQWYNGLGLALTEQREARKSYENGAYQDAIFYSLRARALAINLIKATQTYISQEDQTLDPVENAYAAKSPAAKDIDDKFKKKLLSRDKDAVTLRVDSLKTAATPSAVSSEPEPAPVVTTAPAVLTPVAQPTPVTPAATPAASAKTALEGFVAYVEGSLVIINIGTQDGVQPGMIFTVHHIKADVKDPVTGAVIDQVTVPLAEITVQSVKEKAASCQVTKTLNQSFEITVKDQVKLQ